MYSTGTSTGVNDLMTKLRDFCEANGWTRDADGTEGTGRRWHAHRGSVYVNFRSHDVETANAAISQATSTVSSVAFNVGTGYSGASPWYGQAGVPVGTSSLYITAGVTRVSSTIPAYHFFAHNGGDQILVVLEYASGLYQYFGFGTLNKFGTYTGGEYFFGSRSGVDNTAFGGNGVIPRVGFFTAQSSSGASSVGLINATVDAEAGWKWSVASQSNRPLSGVRYITDNQARHTSTYGLSPNTVNDLVVFMPVIATCFRDTGNASYRSPIGELPKVYFCDIRTLNPGQQVVLGSTDYRVFPFYKKNVSNTAPSPGAPGATTGDSSYWGFAVEE